MNTFRRAWLAASILGAVTLAVAAGESGDKPVAKLRWSPPKLSDPITIELKDGETQNRLAVAKDYIIVLPAKLKTGATILEGGRNIVMIGGYITVGPNQPDDMRRRGIYLKNAVGTVHLEGVLIDNTANGDFDGIAINAPAAVVQIENCRIIGLTGFFKGNHSDVVQPWGGVKELRIDRLTGSSNYQGLFIPQDVGPIGSTVISHVDLSYSAVNPHHQVTYLLWMTGSEGQRPYPITLDEVYITPRQGQTVGENSVWPSTTRPAAVAAVQTDKTVSWPKLPQIKGVVKVGPPPQGEFVPDGAAGLNYKSPGYEEP